MAAPKVSEVSFKFDVQNISALNEVSSPQFHIYGVPWKVKVCKKNKNNEPYLAARLFCAKKDKSSNWTHAATATFKLFSSAVNVNAIVKHASPYVYDSKGLGYGDRMIWWPDLFDVTKGYVQDDAIQLDIKIKMADPNKKNKSELTLEEIERNCEEGCLTKFRLTVTNIENLMATRSSTFTLRNEPWDMTVFKSHSDQLGIRLGCNSTSTEFSCKTKVSVKLVPMKTGGKKIEQEQMKQIKPHKFMQMQRLIPWYELRNPENGFINNNSIVIEVEIKTENPDGIAQGNKRKSSNPRDVEAKRYELECMICLNRFEGQNVSFTPCGHMFCSDCLKDAIKIRKKCPVCNKNLRATQVKRAHLPL